MHLDVLVVRVGVGRRSPFLRPREEGVGGRERESGTDRKGEKELQVSCKSL